MRVSSSGETDCSRDERDLSLSGIGEVSEPSEQLRRTEKKGVRGWGCEKAVMRVSPDLIRNLIQFSMVRYIYI